MADKPPLTDIQGWLRDKAQPQMQPAMREEKLGDSSFIRCSIYTDILPGGQKSPGFVPVHDTNGFPAAWVVLPSAYRNRNVRTVAEPELTSESPDAFARWASQHVRLVQVLFTGAIFKPDPLRYDVLVPAPFRSSKFGFIDIKRGEEIQFAVPAGKSLAELQRKSLTNMSLPLSGRLDAARAHFKTQDGYYRALAQELQDPKFPDDSDRWS